LSDENAVLRERRDVSPSLAIYRIAPLERAPAAFLPGQFTNLGLYVEPEPGSGRRLVRRAFSIASPPDERGHLEFYLRRIDEGELSSRLFQLAPGDRLWLDPRVYGRFTLSDVPDGADLLLVGTGTGIAPFLSMLRAFRGRARWGRCVMLESAHDADELGYRSELEALARDDPSFAYEPTLTREPAESGWTGLRGRVQRHLEPGAFLTRIGRPLDASWHAFLCGNPSMITEVARLLELGGLALHRRSRPGQIHTERYW